MVKAYFRLCRPYSWLVPTLKENSLEKCPGKVMKFTLEICVGTLIKLKMYMSATLPGGCWFHVCYHGGWRTPWFWDRKGWAPQTKEVCDLRAADLWPLTPPVGKIGVDLPPRPGGSPGGSNRPLEKPGETITLTTGLEPQSSWLPGGPYR